MCPRHSPAGLSADATRKGSTSMCGAPGHMRVMVTGASPNVLSHIVAGLGGRGHDVHTVADTYLARPKPHAGEITSASRLAASRERPPRANTGPGSSPKSDSIRNTQVWLSGGCSDRSGSLVVGTQLVRDAGDHDVGLEKQSRLQA